MQNRQARLTYLRGQRLLPDHAGLDEHASLALDFSVDSFKFELEQKRAHSHLDLRARQKEAKSVCVSRLASSIEVNSDP